jgi:uncharacterized protein (TIGR02246 family)
MAVRSNALRADTPAALHALIEATFANGDLDGYVAAYEDDAVLVAPPSGRVARGRSEIRAAAAPIFDLSPRLTSVVYRTVQTDDGFALTRARWELVATAPDGSTVRHAGRAAMVSRRRADGTWGIVLDDPLTGE